MAPATLAPRPQLRDARPVGAGAAVLRAEWLPLAATAVLFVVLFADPARTLARDLWTNPDAGHGLLLIPVAFWLAWKRGIRAGATPQPVLGALLLLGAVVLRYAGGLAAELFTMRVSMVAAACALVVFHFGFRQVLHWWLAITLIVLSIPLPAVVLNSLAFPLQLQASRMGAALLELRGVPVLLDGNMIHLPGRTLFVAEACSGLRSLTALVALGVMVGGLWLRHPITRIALLAIAIPVAIVLNGLRVFITGFLVYFVDPALADGFVHVTEGWAIFVIAFAVLGACAWVLLHLERVAVRPLRLQEAAT